MKHSKRENNEYTEYEHRSEEEKIKRAKHVTHLMLNELEEELAKEYVHPHILTLFEHAQIIAIKPGINNQQQ